MDALALGRSRPVAVLKQMIKKEALKDYGYILGGAVAGATVPSYVMRGLQRINLISDAPGTATMLGVGSLTSIGMGGVVAMLTKNVSRGVQFAGGALASGLGMYLAMKVQESLPMSGLGRSDTAVRRAVESEIRKQVGLGQYLTASEVEGASTVSGGLGQFLTSQAVEEAGVVSGLGMDIDEGSEAFDGFDGGAF